MPKLLTEPLPPLGWLRAFEAAARRLNFTEAAMELGITQAAVSQQIRLLESTLGTTLFRRLRRGVALTAEGAAYLPHVQSGFAILSRSTRELFSPRASGTVRLRSPISFAVLWLAPRLREIGESGLGISIDISTIHVPEHYGAPDTDFDIRFGVEPFPGRRAVRLTEERLVPVAARSYGGGPDEDWTSLPRLSLSGGREMWSQWFSFAGLSPQDGPAHRFDSFVAALAAALAGAGVLLGSRPLIDGLLASGELKRLSDRELASASGHYLTYAEGRSLTSAAITFLHWMSDPRPMGIRNVPDAI